MSRVTGRRKRIIITTAAMMAVGTGAAFAYWSGTGTTSATAVAGKSVAFKISSTAPAGALTPGAPSQSAGFTVKNENSGVQYLESLVVKVANPDGTPWTAGGCSKDDFVVSPPAFSVGQGLKQQIEGGGTVSGTVSIQMVNRAQNQDGCQGVSVPLHFAAS
jgi:P pilus assembly chaperone PapD